MKSIIVFLVFAIPGFAAGAQTKLVVDKESLFTSEEASRIDSLLRDYNQNSGNLVMVCSDTADVSTKSYDEELNTSFATEIQKSKYCVFVLLSQKNSTIQMVSRNLKNNNVDQEKGAKTMVESFMEILKKAAPSFKAKKREEGVTIICKGVMDFLDNQPQD